MANITKDVYVQYADKIVSVLKDDAFYSQFKKRVDDGASNVKLIKKRLIQDISIDWIDTIEDCLPNLDTIVRNPRKFIVQEEDIVDVSLARSISTESVKHLAQHTNMISKVDKEGNVTPSKILNITKEESFEIYENRFIYTLLLKLKDFVTMRYDKIKKASATQDILELDVESRFNLPSKKVTYRTEYFAQLSFDEVMQLDPDTLTKIERVAKIDRIITDFLSSPFAKSMRSSAPVRPPITRTNVILKEPNFKKALTLWQFVETYQQTGGFSTSDDIEEFPVEEENSAKIREMVTLNTMLFESIYDQCETDLDMEDKEFADFIRVGEMDFEKDEIDRDEYAQKLDEETLNQEEEENIEEVRPEEETQEEEKTEEEQEPEQPEPEEQEVETPVEEETEVEAPPKEEPEDTEPDAEQFDQNLFDVRKLFKRPDDDKIKQEEIIRVKDAIDRCLTAYRRIKQEELNEFDRRDRIRRHKEDVEKRAEAFRKQREALAANRNEEGSVYFGIDPFSNQKAKIAAKKAEEDNERIKLNKNEKLELEDKNTDEITDSIKRMEAENAERSKRNAAEDRELEKENDRKESGESDESVNEVLRLNEEISVAETEVENAKTEEDAEKIGGNSAYANKNEVPAVNNTDEKDADVKKTSFDIKQADDTVEIGIAKRPRIRIINEGKTDVWNLSATTLNQKYSKPSGRNKKLEAVDETKVSVGDIHIESGGVNPWETSVAVIKPTKQSVKKSKKFENPEKGPKAVKKAGLNAPEERIDAKITIGKPAEIKSVKPKESKPSAKSEKVARDVEKRKPEIKFSTDTFENENFTSRDLHGIGLSPTTLNQKYSKPDGKPKNLTPIDEKKVAVGNIRIENEEKINPYAELERVKPKKKTKKDNEED